MYASPPKPSRIGQWNGRRRSSRCDDPVLPHLWQRPVLLRLAARACATAATVTFMAYHWGPSQHYRVGQRHLVPHDLPGAHLLRGAQPRRDRPQARRDRRIPAPGKAQRSPGMRGGPPERATRHRPLSLGNAAGAARPDGERVAICPAQSRGRKPFSATQSSGGAASGLRAWPCSSGLQPARLGGRPVRQSLPAGTCPESMPKVLGVCALVVLTLLVGLLLSRGNPGTRC